MNYNTRQMNWQRDLAKGKIGEQYAKQLLESMNCTVEDLSDDNFYRNIDVDFNVIDCTNLHALVEVKKQNFTKYDNFLFELHNDRPSGNRCPGWFHKCRADYIMFVEPDAERAYLLHWNDDVRNELIKQCNTICFKNKSDGGYSTLYKLSIKTAHAKGWIKHSWNEPALYLNNPYLF